ncbi:MAG: hypothetical protein HY819_17365 [Acidobacteria bacterium]|nr:hypothetical protein [Acidobacteriota bacterium]
MEEIVLASICSRLTIGQPIQVRTVIGRILKGEFLSYERTALTGILMLSYSGNTFCLPSDQIDRVFLVDDDNIDDTLSPNILLE